MTTAHNEKIKEFISELSEFFAKTAEDTLTAIEDNLEGNKALSPSLFRTNVRDPRHRTATGPSQHRADRRLRRRNLDQRNYSRKPRPSPGNAWAASGTRFRR